jgi:hypothetical protein
MCTMPCSPPAAVDSSVTTALCTESSMPAFAAAVLRLAEWVEWVELVELHAVSRAAVQHLAHLCACVWPYECWMTHDVVV